VASYGQIAHLAGFGGQARLVGYALHTLPEGSDVPWHRVVNARGEVSRRALPGNEELQQRLLEAEGMEFNALGRLSMDRYRWRPRAPVQP
jgi:methylated-DNA-protein-cysteine methyltransferase-like protein